MSPRSRVGWIKTSISRAPPPRATIFGCSELARFSRPPLTVTPEGISEEAGFFGNPDFNAVGEPFDLWMTENHPDDADKVGFVEWASVVLGGVAGVSAALADAGVWSLVVQLLVASAARCLGVLVAARLPLRLAFDRASLSNLIGFSANLLGFTTISHWLRSPARWVSR